MVDIDPGFKKAISDAVSSQGQNDKVTARLSNWFEKILEGSEKIENKDSAFKYLELIYDVIELEDDN